MGPMNSMNSMNSMSSLGPLGPLNASGPSSAVKGLGGLGGLGGSEGGEKAEEGSEWKELMGNVGIAVTTVRRATENETWDLGRKEGLSVDGSGAVCEYYEGCGADRGGGEEM